MTTDDLPEFKIPDAEDHRIEARHFLARAEQPGLTAEGSIAYGVLAVAHALLASAPVPLEPIEGYERPGTVTASGILLLAMICGTVIAVAWILAG